MFVLEELRFFATSDFESNETDYFILQISNSDWKPDNQYLFIPHLFSLLNIGWI